MLVMPRVGADEFHLRTLQRHIEHTGIGGVGEVETHHLALVRLER